MLSASLSLFPSDIGSLLFLDTHLSVLLDSCLIVFDGSPVVLAVLETFERGCNARGRLQAQLDAQLALLLLCLSRFREVPRVPGHLELMAGGGDQTLNPRRRSTVGLIWGGFVTWLRHVSTTLGSG